MKYYKTVVNGYITMVGAFVFGVEITEEEYHIILDVIKHKPTPREGYDYMLQDGTLEWVEVEIPDEPIPVMEVIEDG